MFVAADMPPPEPPPISVAKTKKVQQWRDGRHFFLWALLIMERIKENLLLRLEESHQHAKAAALILFALGLLSVFFLNHSSKATSTFWQYLITFVVNLVPKADYRCISFNFCSSIMLASLNLNLFKIQALRCRH